MCKASSSPSEDEHAHAERHVGVRTARLLLRARVTNLGDCVWLRPWAREGGWAAFGGEVIRPSL